MMPLDIREVVKIDCLISVWIFTINALLKFQISVHTEILENLTEARNSLEELWEKRKVKLDLSLELRYLEYDYDQVCRC